MQTASVEELPSKLSVQSTHRCVTTVEFHACRVKHQDSGLHDGHVKAAKTQLTDQSTNWKLIDY